jgi:hypothetical protein
MTFEQTVGTCIASAMAAAFVFLLVKWRRWKRDHPYGDIPPDEAGFYDPR